MVRVAFDTRFWSRVDRDPDRLFTCWLWTGQLNAYGYGSLSRSNGRGWSGEHVAAHRISWVLHTRGPIPVGMNVLHRCDEPSCVNPAHLFLGTLAENQEDCVRKGRHPLAIKTHCVRGHPLSGENLEPVAGKPRRRVCRKCCVIRHRSAGARRALKKLAGKVTP